MSDLFDYHLRWIDIQQREGEALLHEDQSYMYRKIAVVSLAFMTLFLILGLAFLSIESVYSLSFLMLQTGSWVIFIMAMIKARSEIGKSTDIYIQLGRELDQLGDDFRKEYS